MLIEKERRNIRENQVSPVVEKKRDNSSYLEDLIEKSKTMNENSNRAITDGMSLIFTKMSELEQKNEEKWKREMESIKIKFEEESRRKGSIEVKEVVKVVTIDKTNKEKENELYARVIELEMVQSGLFRLSREKSPRGTDYLKRSNTSKNTRPNS